MIIQQLFNNLRNHNTLKGCFDFSEDNLDLLRTLDFGVKEKRQCTKGYPCRRSCISRGYSCKDPIEGQAKTYAQWLELQNKKDDKPKTGKSTTKPRVIQANLADFESIKALGERLADKYIGQIDKKEIENLKKELDSIDKELDKASELVSAKNADASLFGKRRELLLKITATELGISLAEYQDYLDTEYKYKSAKASLDRFNQGKAIANRKLTGEALEAERERLITDFISKEKEYFEKRNRVNRERNDHSKLYQDLIVAGGKSEADANTWLNSLGKRTAKVKKSDQAFKDVYRLTGGNIQTLKSVGYEKPRAFANKERGFINVGKSENKAVIFHEVGHHLEYSNPDIQASAAQFLQKRSTGQTQTLRKITGDKAYKPDEVAIVDNFIDPYVGKIYKSGSTEVISMGLERFSTPEAMKTFRDKDPEHFHYILGVLAYVNNLKS